MMEKLTPAEEDHLLAVIIASAISTAAHTGPDEIAETAAKLRQSVTGSLRLRRFMRAIGNELLTVAARKELSRRKAGQPCESRDPFSSAIVAEQLG